MAIEFAALISDHSDVWARGVAQEELNDADKVVFENLVIAKNEATYSFFAQSREIEGLDGALGNVVIFALFLHRHPGARQFWGLSARPTSKGTELPSTHRPSNSIPPMSIQFLDTSKNWIEYNLNSNFNDSASVCYWHIAVVKNPANRVYWATI